MSRTVSNAFKQAVFAQETDVAFILLVTLSNPGLTDDIRVASDPFELLPYAGERGVISRGLEFIYLPFSLSLPTEDDTSIAKAKISIDNVSREIVGAIRQTVGEIAFKVEIVLSSDVDTPESTLDDFILESVTYDALTIEGEISVQYFDLEPFPKARIVPSDFPGAF